MIVSVNPLPDFNLSVNEPCEQSNLIFSVDLTNNSSTAGIYSSSWNGPNGFASTVLNPSISNVTSAATGVYNFELIDNNKCSKSKSINALINLVDNILLHPVLSLQETLTSSHDDETSRLLPRSFFGQYPCTTSSIQEAHSCSP